LKLGINSLGSFAYLLSETRQTTLQLFLKQASQGYLELSHSTFVAEGRERHDPWRQGKELALFKGNHIVDSFVR
jgi:hypothetical protein